MKTEEIKKAIEGITSLEDLRSLRNVLHYAILKNMSGEMCDLHEEAAYHGAALSNTLTDIKDVYHEEWLHCDDYDALNEI